MKRSWSIAAALLLLVLALPVPAHQMTVSYLNIEATSDDTYQVEWTTSRQETLEPVFSGETRILSERSSSRKDKVKMVYSWTMKAEESLVGQRLRIQGLENSVTEVLVRIVLPDGGVVGMRLSPANPGVMIPPAPSAFAVVKIYTVLGIEHILGGIDHLLFVLALLLIIRNVPTLLKAITAFTVAHSVTLALASLGFVHVPGPPVEAIIALSIVFVASEILHQHRRAPGLAERSPWLVAAAFGLLHGFGFAGALAEIGLPEGEIPLALLTFNVGVELGQLLFVAAALFIGWGGARFWQWPAWAKPAMAYGIGGVAAYWVIDRVAGFV